MPCAGHRVVSEVVQAYESTGPRPLHTAILDPYAVYIEGGEVLLSAQLSALDIVHLRGIVVAHELAPSDVAAAASSSELTDTILAAVRPAAPALSGRGGS